MKINIATSILWMILLAGALIGCRYSRPLSEGNERMSQVEFLEVNGTSRLPLEFMRTGKNKDKLEFVTLPRYWIASRPISETVFAKVMGRPLDGCLHDRAMCKVEWAEAQEFCTRLTKQYAECIPTNCIVSLPTMIEWAHAVRIMEDKVDFNALVGTHLFTGSVNRGYLYTMCSGNLSEVTNADVAVDFICSPKYYKDKYLGLRPVLINTTSIVDGKNVMAIRGMTALEHGEFETAKAYLELALAKGRLDKNDRVEVEDALKVAQEDRDEDQEDWSGLVSRSAGFARKRGYATQPFAEAWQMSGWKSLEDRNIADTYEQFGIRGRWMKLGDLPKDLRQDQHIGDGYNLQMFIGSYLENTAQDIDSNFVVQTLECDFDGDGYQDVVAEIFGENGIGIGDDSGYAYCFYRGLPDGSYTNLLKQQVVGLCALPRKKGKGCGFLVVEKISNPVFSVHFLSFEGNSVCREKVNERPFCMIDANEDRIYLPAPFIGAYYGLGWQYLRAWGIWYRPLYWPWKSGEVQGLETAREFIDRMIKEAV